MQSQNFEFLRPTWDDLATLGAFAENYSHTDPSSATVKLRSFAEQIVLFIYHNHGLPKPYQCNLNDLLTNPSFVQAVPKVIVSKLHSLRIHGNRAAHGESVLAQTALWMLQEAYELGRWLHLSYGRGSAADCPPFALPAPREAPRPNGSCGARERRSWQTWPTSRPRSNCSWPSWKPPAPSKPSRKRLRPSLQAAQMQGQRVADRPRSTRS